IMSERNKIQYTNEGLIIAGISNRSRWLFLLYWMLLISIMPVLLYLFGFNTLLIAGIVGFISLSWRRLRIPANFRPVKVRKDRDFVYVNHKVLPLEELLFLSIHETEGYAIIRLEARRTNILFPREARLLSDCSGFKEALQLCREIRDFIDPDLKINHVMWVSGKGRNIGRWGSRRIEFEHWEFIQ
ncbi:MAG TPA: hypothetical protein VL092_12985, partial [Chitinophagaceae bacterium]|nr:hypothetical protein [Chitinophagaceae bacterium]